MTEKRGTDIPRKTKIGFCMTKQEGERWKMREE